MIWLEPDEAMQLSAKVERTFQPAEASSATADEMESAFRERVRYVATMDNAYQRAQRLTETLNKPGGLPIPRQKQSYKRSLDL